MKLSLPIISFLILKSVTDLNAKSYILYDYTNNNIIKSLKPNLRLPQASITKIMTSYVIFNLISENIFNENSYIEISDQCQSEIARVNNSIRIFIEKKNKIKLENLLKGIIIASGNDACNCISRYLKNNHDISLVKLMNLEAKKMGLKNTNFVNTTGLSDKNHYSSVYDIMIISKNLIKNYSYYYNKYFNKRYFKFGKYRFPNYNELLSLKITDFKCDGIKTGFTKSAGFCLAASAIKNEKRLICIVLNCNSRDTRKNLTKKLFNDGFKIIV